MVKPVEGTDTIIIVETLQGASLGYCAKEGTPRRTFIGAVARHEERQRRKAVYGADRSAGHDHTIRDLAGEDSLIVDPCAACGIAPSGQTVRTVTHVYVQMGCPKCGSTTESATFPEAMIRWNEVQRERRMRIASAAIANLAESEVNDVIAAWELSQTHDLDRWNDDGGRPADASGEAA